MSGHVLAPRRAPYSFAELERLVQPRSVSVIGASDTPGSFGANTSFEGRLYPVNPNRQTVFGLKCWPSVSALPEPVDLAVLIIPAASVPAALTECADCGVGSAVIYSSGFAELGTPEAISAQAAIAEIARTRGLRVLGPNCIGLANMALKFGATFMPSLRELPLAEGPVALVSQGARLHAAAGHAPRRRLQPLADHRQRLRRGCG